MKFAHTLVIVLPLLVILSSAGPKQKQNQMEQGNFAHTVFFWLKNPDNQNDRENFEKSIKKFINQSIFIKTKHLGVPAATNRDVIDATYTYSLLLTFENKAQQDKYQDEPAHKIFIAESSGLWNKVIVYDSENLLQ